MAGTAPLASASRRWLVEVVSDAGRRQYLVPAAGWREAIAAVRERRDERTLRFDFYSQGPDAGEAFSTEGDTHYRALCPPEGFELPRSASERPSGPPSGRDVGAESSQIAVAPTRAVIAPTHAVIAPNAALADDDQSLVLLYERAERQMSELPVAYRERGYLVPSGATPNVIGRALLQELKVLQELLAQTSTRKYVRLAAFDHRFTTRPERPPVAGLVWRDWRGAPELEIGGVALTPQELARTFTSESGKFPRVAGREGAAAILAGIPVATVEPPSPDELREREERSPRELRTASVTPGDDDAPASRADIEARFVEASPRIENGQGDDLVAELFERMHMLHYSADVADGARFVLDVITEFLPCDAALIHVWDASKREFCVVGARGADPASALLERTSASDPLFREVLSDSAPWATRNADRYPHFRLPHYSELTAEPGAALLGAARHGQRVLAMIELIRAAGGRGFFGNEVNAIEYIGQQLAEFLAERPLVLEPDSIRRRALAK